LRPFWIESSTAYIADDCVANFEASLRAAEGIRLQWRGFETRRRKVESTGLASSLHLIESCFGDFVNLDPVDAPADLVSVRVDFPRDVKPDRIAVASLRMNWRSTPAPMELRDIGMNWLNSASSLCLIVPSAVIPEESNVLINPDHPDFKKLRFFRPRKFTFDPRMWKDAARPRRK
jgi:hypothetical protein